MGKWDRSGLLFAIHRITFTFPHNSVGTTVFTVADPRVQKKLRRENAKLKCQVERKNYEEVLKIFDVHEEQAICSKPQELSPVKVGSKKHIDYSSAAGRLLETHKWPVHNGKKMLSERIRGWATRFDHAARVADKRAKKWEHDTEIETFDPPTATREAPIEAKICAANRLKAVTKKE